MSTTNQLQNVFYKWTWNLSVWTSDFSCLKICPFLAETPCTYYLGKNVQSRHDHVTEYWLADAWVYIFICRKITQISTHNNHHVLSYVGQSSGMSMFLHHRHMSILKHIWIDHYLITRYIPTIGNVTSYEVVTTMVHQEVKVKVVQWQCWNICSHHISSLRLQVDQLVYSRSVQEILSLLNSVVLWYPMGIFHH